MCTVRAALAVIASLLRAGQVQMFTQTIEQRRARIDSRLYFFPFTRRVTGMRLLPQALFLSFPGGCRFGARVPQTQDPLKPASSLFLTGKETSGASTAQTRRERLF
jgi:hypothetical protein